MNKTAFSLFESAIDLINNLIYLVIGLALVGFLWGVLRFLFSGGSDKLKKEGKDFMIYGILILFVMTTLWAIILFARDFVFGSGYKGDIDSGVDIIDSPSSDQPFENTDQLFEEQPQYAV